MPSIAELIEKKQKAPIGGSIQDMIAEKEFEPPRFDAPATPDPQGLPSEGLEATTMPLAERRLPIKPRRSTVNRPEVYGPGDIWTSPADSELWQGPGARFTKGIAPGVVKATMIDRLIGKPLPPAETKAEKTGEAVGSIAEMIAEYLIMGGLVTKAAGALPKAVTAADKALRTGLRFGGVGATRQARKGATEAIHGTDEGYEGATGVLKDFAIGAVLSLAVSGIGATGKAIWGKLRPTEQAQALKLLGLKKGASEEQIMSASRKIASKYHPDKVKGMVGKFKETIKARETLLKSKDIAKAGVRIPKPKQITGLSEDKILMDILYKHGTAKAPTSTEKINPASLRSIADLMHKKVPKTSKGTNVLVKSAWGRIAKATKQELPKPLLAPESLEEAIGAAQLPVKPPVRPVQLPKPAISPAAEGGVYERFYKGLGKKIKQRQTAEVVTEHLAETKAIPAKINKKFWQETYDKLDSTKKAIIDNIVDDLLATEQSIKEKGTSLPDAYEMSSMKELQSGNIAELIAMEFVANESLAQPPAKTIKQMVEEKGKVKRIPALEARKQLKELNERWDKIDDTKVSDMPELVGKKGKYRTKKEATSDISAKIKDIRTKQEPIKIDLGGGQIIEVRGYGATTYWRTAGSKEGFVLASPSHRQRIDIALATKLPAVAPEKARRKGGVMPPVTPKPKKKALGLSPARLKQFVTEGLKVAKMTKAEMGQVELQPTEISSSDAVNKHIDYFEGITLPDTSKIRPIQRNLRKINGLRLSGKITAAEANRRIRLLKTELFSTALKEGVSVRTTKRGGRTVLALRQAGTYVPEEFSKYTKFKDIQPLFGGGQDITRAIQQMDGSLSVKQKKQVKGQAGPIERHVLWPTRDMTKQKLEFVKEQAARLNSFLTVKRKSKNDTLVNNVLRQIKSGETLQDALKNKKVLAYTKNKKIINQAVKLRAWFDDMINDQNALRQLRNQDEIPFRGKYSPEILRDATIWERVMAKDKKPRQIIQGVELPDYIKPNKPFNPRELARDAGIPYEERVKSATQLARNYLVTAAKDIFNTSIIQNNKAFIQQLEAMGHEKSAGYLSDWTAEAYAGVKPKLDRAIKLPKKIERQMRRFNQARNIAIFPLNFAWNLTTQPSSLAFTVSKYGAKNTVMGFMDWMKPSVRAKAAKDYYSYIVKTHKAGKVSRQDVMNLVGENVAIKRTKGEMVYDVTTLMINEMEKLLTGMSIQAAYRHGKAKGLKGKALQEYASDGGAKTQSMYNDEDRPALLRSLGVKTLTPFQTFNYETVNNLREWAGRTGTPPENNTVRVAQIVRFLAAAAVFRMIAKKMANKDIYTWDRMPMPFSEYWFSPIVKGLTGKEYSLEYNLPSPVSVGVRIGKGLKDVYEAGSWQRLRRELITYGTGYLHIPGGVQINRTVEALIAYSKGGVYDRSGKKMFDVEKDELKKAIFAGVYSTKGGKKYIEKKKGKKKSEYPEDF